MKLLPIIFITLSLLQMAPCFQTCIVDFVRRLLTPRKPTETLVAEHRLPLLNRLRNAPKSALNEKGKLNDVPIIKKGVDVIMEGTTTAKPEDRTMANENNDNKIRNNITIITRSEVDVLTEGDGIDARLNDDLLDSFGGTDDKNDFGEGESPKNGMYFLLDWNTFLEVDDQNGKSVNLRVQPKIGDPKQFIDVTVP